MQLASKPVASHEHIIFSLKEYKVSLREPWLLWATFLFRLSVPIIGKPLFVAILILPKRAGADNLAFRTGCMPGIHGRIGAADGVSQFQEVLL